MIVVFKENKQNPLIIASLIVLVNGVIGHFSFFGILFTPLVITITTHKVCQDLIDIKLSIKIILSYLLIAVNDFMTRLFGGGTHDITGNTLVLLFSALGLVFALLVIIRTMYNSKEQLSVKFFSLMFFMILIYIHYLLFRNLGIESFYLKS